LASVESPNARTLCGTFVGRRQDAAEGPAPYANDDELLVSIRAKHTALSAS